MKIFVREQDKTVVQLCIPNAVVCNRLMASVIVKQVNKHSPKKLPVTASQLHRLMCELKRCAKHFKPLTLVEVESSDGETVRITL